MIATTIVKGASTTRYMFLNIVKISFKSTFYNCIIYDFGMLSLQDLSKVNDFLINFLQSELYTWMANS